MLDWLWFNKKNKALILSPNLFGPCPSWHDATKILSDPFQHGNKKAEASLFDVRVVHTAGFEEHQFPGECNTERVKINKVYSFLTKKKKTWKTFSNLNQIVFFIIIIQLKKSDVFFLPSSTWCAWKTFFFLCLPPKWCRVWLCVSGDIWSTCNTPMTGAAGLCRPPCSLLLSQQPVRRRLLLLRWRHPQQSGRRATESGTSRCPGTGQETTDFSSVLAAIWTVCQWRGGNTFMSFKEVCLKISRQIRRAKRQNRFRSSRIVRWDKNKYFHSWYFK